MFNIFITENRSKTTNVLGKFCVSPENWFISVCNLASKTTKLCIPSWLFFSLSLVTFLCWCLLTYISHSILHLQWEGASSDLCQHIWDVCTNPTDGCCYWLILVRVQVEEKIHSSFSFLCIQVWHRVKTNQQPQNV